MKNKIILICIGIAMATYATAQKNTSDTNVKKKGPSIIILGPITPEQRAQLKARQIDYQNMMDQLHITLLRPGKNDTPDQPNSANYDESKANPFPNLPNPLIENSGKRVTTEKEWWSKRRPEILEEFDKEIYGRVPKNVPKVTWKIVSLTNEIVSDIPVITKKIIGHVDNSTYPAIDVNIALTLTMPAHVNGSVPVIMVLGSDNSPVGGAISSSASSKPNPSTAREQLIRKGWGYAFLNTNSVQANNGAWLTAGIIGLCNKGQYRKPDDWGALRAWAWGASRSMDYLETEKAVNPKKVGIEGNSQWGKGAIVTMAYDQRFAIAYISSSGEGGIKLYRRNAGEVVENLTAGVQYHLMAGNFLKYAGPLNWGEIPIDAHELVALCAPRPVFVSAGSAGDSLQDPQGMFMGAAAATPVYTLLGKKGVSSNVMPKTEVLLNGDIAFRRHLEGHTDEPNWPFFISYASQYFK